MKYSTLLQHLQSLRPEQLELDVRLSGFYNLDGKCLIEGFDCQGFFVHPGDSCHKEDQPCIVFDQGAWRNHDAACHEKAKKLAAIKRA